MVPHQAGARRETGSGRKIRLWFCPRDKRALLRGIHRGSSQYLAHQSRKVDLAILLMHIEEISCTTWPPTELEDLL